MDSFLSLGEATHRATRRVTLNVGGARNVTLIDGIEADERWMRRPNVRAGSCP